MDKWKDAELAKMKVGGNKKGKTFLQDQPDWKDEWSIIKSLPVGQMRPLLIAKYNSKACALLRDKVDTESQGKTWLESQSPAQNYTPPVQKQFNQSQAGSSFDQRFKQNQSGGMSSSNSFQADQAMNQLNDIGGKAFGALSTGLSKTWGFASTVASQATDKVNSGEVSNLANQGFGFLSNVTKSLGTAASQGVTSLSKNVQGLAAPAPENPNFWNNFGDKPVPKPEKQDFWDGFGEKNLVQTSSGGFGGFGGNYNDDDDMYGQSKKDDGGFSGFSSKDNKKDDWGDDW